MNIGHILSQGTELFSAPPSISTINSLSSAHSTTEQDTVNIRIWQNHSAAIFQKTLLAICSYHSVCAAIDDQGYDDSFSWHGLNQLDIPIVWVDIDRLEGGSASALEWFSTRIVELTNLTTLLPIVILASEERLTAQSWVESLRTYANTISIWDLPDLSESIDKSPIDARMKSIGGTYVAMVSQASIASAVIKWVFEQINFPPKKLIVIDFDWTMYDGVLLEDGPENVILQSHHLTLWKILKQAYESGVMLAIASKNEQKLVEEFFDFHSKSLPLNLSDFITVEAHFGPKSESIAKAISLARTTDKDTIFIDDNVGELAEVEAKFKSINLVIGGLGNTTNNWLNSFPGIKWGKIDSNAQTRVADIKARAERESFAKETGNHEVNSEFLNNMELEVSFSLNNPENVDRLTDMIARTNQFNSNLERRTPSEIKSSLNAGSRFVTASLKDRFVDSGIIFAALGHNEKSTFVVDNLVLSCRAMGRGLEPLIVGKGLNLLATESDCSKIEIGWVKGPRNLPFLEFLEKTISSDLPPETQGASIINTVDFGAPLSEGPIVKLYVENGETDADKN